MEQRLSKFYSFSEILKQRGMKEHVRIIRFDEIDAGENDVASHLGLEPHDKVFKLTRLRLVDLTPYTLETSYIPVALFPDLTEEMIKDKGLYNAMRANSVSPDRVIEKFRATVIRKAEAAHMDLKIGIPAMHLERVTYAGTKVIEYCSSIVRGDFFIYTVELK
jgi:GntR family transcriptional regulator